MSSILITPLEKAFNTSLKLPGSKSLTNRALIMAALCEEESRLEGILVSDDTEACREALRHCEDSNHQKTGDIYQKRRSCVGATGSRPSRQLAKIIPRTTKGDRRSPLRKIVPHYSLASLGELHPYINCHDAGTVARFLFPVCAALGGVYHFDASPRLRKRPIKPLLDILQQQGVKFEFLKSPHQMPLFMHSSGLSGGEIFIDTQDSSQFLSGLCIAAPLTQKGMCIQSSTSILHKPYVLMTLQLMQKFGISHQYLDNCTLEIIPGQYKATTLVIEPDASTASYFFAAAALTQSTIFIENLTNESCQGDLKFLGILDKIGCKVSKISSGISVTGPQHLQSLGEINMAGFTDTFMTLAIIAPFLPTPTTIHGLRHTRQQESDRVAAISEGLERVGIRTENTEDSLTIFPGIPQGNKINSHRDHRIAMAFGILGLKIPGLIIEDAKCVSKTCPDFFQYLKQLGENAHVQ